MKATKAISGPQTIDANRFIIRALDVLRDFAGHGAPLPFWEARDDECAPKLCLWQITSAAKYGEILRFAFGAGAFAELHRRIGAALAGGDVGNALFLVLVYAELEHKTHNGGGCPFDAWDGLPPSRE